MSGNQAFADKNHGKRLKACANKQWQSQF